MDRPFRYAPDPAPAFHQARTVCGEPTREATPGRWCPTHHVVHVSDGGTCPDGNTRAAR